MAVAPDIQQRLDQEPVVQDVDSYDYEADDAYFDFWKRVRKSVDHSREALAGFRDNRLEYIQQQVGIHYSEDEGAEDKVPINFVEMYLSLLTRRLAAQNPRVMARTSHWQYKPRAASLEAALNKLLPDIEFSDELLMALQDAIVAIGIMKVGLSDDGWMGRPFARHVDFDDFVIDMQATRWNQIKYIGDRYRIPYEDVMDNDDFDEEAKKFVKPLKSSYTDDQGHTRASSIMHGGMLDDDEFDPDCELLDLWMPRYGALVTLPGAGDGIPLKVQRMPKMKKPHLGPYRPLYFNRVLAQLMPLPPAANIMDLHLAQNELFNLSIRQASRQKTIVAARGSAKDDAERVKNAKDGEIILVDNPEDLKEIRFGGADPATFATTIQLKDLANWRSGNIESLAGLGMNADTAKQEQLINTMANGAIEAMESTVVLYVTEVVGELAMLLWEDPITEYEITKRLPGSDMTINTYWSPEDRTGSLNDYEISIEPFSLRHKSPEQRAELTFKLWTMIMQSLPIMQAQKVMPSVLGFLRTMANLLDMRPELEELVIYMQQQPAEQGGEGGGMKPQGPRQYEHINRNAGGTPQARDAAMAQQLMRSARAQSAQQGALVR